MKWEPQPKGRCARPGCNELVSYLGYCMKHAKLFQRNGAPYRQDELDEQRARNRYEQDMDAALRENPPEIVWRKDKHGIMRAVSVKDPHAEKSGDARIDRRRYAAQIALNEQARAIDREAREVADRLAAVRVSNSPLMAAARKAI